MGVDLLSLKEWENETFNGIQLIESDLSNMRFEDCDFVDCQLIDCNLRNASFNNCSFTRSNLSNSPADLCLWGEVLFSECKLIGIDFSNSKKLLFSIRFDDCQLTMCNFSKLKLTETIFKGSQVKECDFFEADLQSADFAGCDLEGSVFESSDLREADFANASNYKIDPTKNKLRHARFSMPEVLSLLEFLELEID